ncbi:MAG: DNA polymerase I [Clostridiales bacterium]|nr:DNA polymerase I [Clostridiales bacterium]MDY3746675.1 DNA polymerase I [Lachnospiraceae bacterium]
MKKIVLIDGHSILNRAFYGVPDLTNSEGLHTNAVYGFLNIMFKILDEEKAEYLAVAFDVHAPTFRHQMYDAYKGTRKAMPDELRQQVPLMKEVLNAMGISIMEMEGFEADDILGTVARQCETAGFLVSVISGDRDLLQLATEYTKIRIPKTKMSGTEVEDYNASDVMAKYQVTPTEFIDMKALMGDTSDNIPGVPGIGEKTAAKIIMTYHSIENAYAHAAEIKPKKASENLSRYYEQAQMSKVLATIHTSCGFTLDVDQAEIKDMYNENAYRIFKRLEFKNILNRFNVETSDDENVADCVVVTDDMNEALVIFNKAESKPYVGIARIFDEDTAGVSLAISEREIYFIEESGFLTGEMLGDMIHKLTQKTKGIFINLKAHVPFADLDETACAFDAGLAAYLLNPLKDSYDYDDIARDYLGQTLPSESDLFGKKKKAEVRKASPEAFKNYVGYMSLVPLKAYPVLLNRLKEDQMDRLYSDVELPLVYVLSDMEQFGIRANRDALKAYGQSLVQKITMLENEIYERAGEKFNINSPKQLGVILFEKLHLPYGKKTKTGYSTSAEVLEKLKNEDPIVKMVLEYRQLTKLKSTYADGLEVYIGDDERIHGKFNQTITATGRISSTEPNLQNIPIRMELGRLIRKVFVPESSYIFMDADYSQIELRVLAHMSDDEALIQAYREDMDIHKITASQVFHVPLEEVTPALRSNAKAVNFGIVYGISSFGLSQDLSITRKEAENYIQQYFKTYPNVKQFLDNAVDTAREKGYSVTMLGRRRPIPELKSSNFMQRSFGERIAMNAPIQGTAADIIKIAMINVSRKLKAGHMKSRLILQVHDELLIETHIDEVEQVRAILENEMKNAVALRVPLEIDIHTGNNWYEAK